MTLQQIIRGNFFGNDDFVVALFKSENFFEQENIPNADKIIVLKDGCVSETGSHSKLLKNKGLYSQYWNTQQATNGWKICAGAH